MAFSYAYARPALTVDCVVFGVAAGEAPELQVLLVRRRDPPFADRWALPGGFVEVSDDGGQGEDIDEAARRELAEETGLRVDYIEQLCTFGRPGRDPRGRVVSVAHYALVRSSDVVGGSDASEARFWSVADVVARRARAGARGGRGPGPLAFDHDEIVQTALDRLRAKVRYAPIGFHLLPREFTLTELQRLYEAILMRALDRPNFRRRMLGRLVGMGILVEAGRQRGVPHRAATTYRFDRRAYDRAVREGFDFAI